MCVSCVVLRERLLFVRWGLMHTIPDKHFFLFVCLFGVGVIVLIDVVTH